MMDVRIRILASLVALTFAACGIIGESKSARQTPVSVNAPNAKVPVLTEADVAKMPRSFTDAESMTIPRKTLEGQISGSPGTLRFRPDTSFTELVRGRAFICSFPDNEVAGLLKVGVKDDKGTELEKSLGGFLARLFPSGQGHFLKAREQALEEYKLSETLAIEDAILLRSFYCLGDTPESYLDGSVAAFETLAAPETVDQFGELNLVENLGVDCSVVATSAGKARLSARWNPAEEFVRVKLPAMNVQWLIDGVELNLPTATVGLGSGVSEEVPLSSKTSIYAARLSDAGGRVVLTCARLMSPEDNSVSVAARQVPVCGSHTEKRNQGVDFQVEVDAGFRDAARIKPYETTCGGSIEAYHLACEPGELMVENSHSHSTEQCVFKKEVCVGGGLVPRVCQEVPEIRHRNKGSVMCQNQTRATRVETRTRVDVVDVTVVNTCDVPFKI